MLPALLTPFSWLAKGTATSAWNLGKGTASAFYRLGKGFGTKVVPAVAKGGVKTVGWAADKTAKNLIEHPGRTLAIGGGLFLAHDAASRALTRHGLVRNAVNYRYF